MISFVIALCALVLGYFTYGKYVAHAFGPDNRQTPCYTKRDGVDYEPMPTWKVYMIQFLNIAGVGPIFGAIMGAQFGTASYIWIVIGTIFAGATHDYLSGMLSMRQDGASLPEIIGEYLGKRTRVVMSLFSVLMLVLVCAVFVSSPAQILSGLTKDWFAADQQTLNISCWLTLIFIYYIIATLCPVDKIIGKIYPFFAFCLLFMAVGIMGYIFVMQPALPEIWDPNSLVNHEWMGVAKLSHLFPMMFISIACGAISGFHATQSPMMARCLKHEKMGRVCFYGAMVTEGIVALVWAAAATVFFGENGLQDAAGNGYTGGQVATAISQNWLGALGGFLALMGIAIAPITSGDTALRGGRLIIADFLHMEQKSMSKRLMISIPMFALTAAVLVWSMSDKDGFGKLWRYFGWSNQTLSVFTLWAITIYLRRKGRNYWISFFPACFMTVVCASFILNLEEGGFGLNYWLSVSSGIVLALSFVGLFFWKKK